MRATHLAAFIALMPAIALAQAEAPRGVATRPSAVNAHTCAVREYYPRLQIEDNIEGSARVGLTIAADGTVQDITIAESSGSDALDQASMLCAATWVYKPATANGQPIATPWKAIVSWSVMSPGAHEMPPPVGADHVCRDHPKDPNNTADPGTAVIGFTIKPDGTVKELILLQSRGDKTYDAYAMGCTGDWQFEHSRQAQKPDLHRRTSVSWSTFP
jgi:TonB family protein